MPILIHFDLKCTVSQYDFIWENLRQLGLDRGEGCLSHIGALKPDGNMIVTDVFNSVEEFHAFGAQLLPIIEKSGATATPNIYPVLYAFSREFQFDRNAEKTAQMVFFKTKCTPEQYSAIWADLDQIELPKGGMSHVGGLGNDGNMVVVDLVESPDVLGEFEANVAPIIAKHGATIEVSVFPVIYGLAGQFQVSTLPVTA